MYKLSFQEEQMKAAIMHTLSFVPGIEKILSIYFSPIENNLKTESYSPSNDNYTIETFDPTLQAGIIDFFRKKRASYTWNKTEEIPFEKEITEQGQLDVFSELDTNVLTLYIPNEYDHKNDLLFIHLKPQLQYYGILKDNAVLSTESKSVIANLTRNSIISFLSNLSNDKKAFESIRVNTKTIIDKQAILKKEYEITKEKYAESVVTYAKLFLSETCDKHNLGEIYFTATALAKIKKYDNEINELKIIIEEAAYYVYNMYSGLNHYQIEIDEIHLRFERTAQIKQESRNIIAPQYYKTLQLLDKLESSIKSVEAQNLLLTSSNVASFCNPPISAPAISDAIKKHKVKILFLFDKYPDKWQHIRTDFKPITNILPEKLISIEKLA